MPRLKYNLFHKNQNEFWPVYLKLAVLAVIIAVLWAFNQYFLTPLIMGVICAVISMPIYRLFTKSKVWQKFRLPRQLGAILTIMAVSLVLFITLNRFTTEVIREAPSFISAISEYTSNLSSNRDFVRQAGELGVSEEVIDDGSKTLNKELNRLLSVFGRNEQATDGRYVISRDDVQTAIREGQQRAGKAFDYVVAFVIFILAWFNALNEGEKWLDSVFALLPFSETEEISIRRDLRLGVQNVIYANLLSGCIHALVCFGIMLLFGIPNIFILTVIIFFIGLLPLSPSELAYTIPLVLIAIQTGNIAAVIALAIVAELIILWVNYVLIPRVIASGNTGGGNSLLILTSILSGITIFGLLGFIIGPIIMIMVQTLYQILIDRIAAEKVDIGNLTQV